MHSEASWVRAPRQPASVPQSSQVTWAAPQTSCDSYVTRYQQPPTRPSLASRLLPATVKHRQRVTAETSARRLEGQASPTPRSTAFVPRHEDIRRRTRRRLGPSEAGARAQPSRRATPSGARRAKPPPLSQRSSPELRTDSCQPYPFSWHTRHAFNERFTAWCSHSLEMSLAPAPASRSQVACARAPRAFGHSRKLPRGSDQCDWMPSLRNDRQEGRCRCREASARTALTATKDGRCDSRLRHRREEGRRLTKGLRKAT